MVASLISVILFVLAALVGPSLAQDQEIVFKRVAVLPFSVASKEPLETLGEKIRQEFQDRLKAEGFTLAPPEELNKLLVGVKEAMTDSQAQDIGRRVKVDVVLYGQLIKVGEVLSLEVRVLDLSGRLPMATLKAQGMGLRSLAGLSRQLAQEAGLKIVGKERVVRLNVKGNRRIEKDAILGVMQTREGEILAPPRLREDLKAIYKMGYFTDVKFDVSDTPEGRILTVLIEEKPSIKEIETQGNRALKKDKILEAMDLKPFSVASETAIRDNINKVLKIYREKGYYEAKITHRLDPVTKTEVNLMLLIDEGGKLAIKNIDFEGNKAFKSKELRKVMETKERSILVSWFTGTGNLNKDMLERDLEKVTAFYYNHGYIKAKMGEARIDIKGKYIYLTIPVEEGAQYKIGKVEVQGDLLEDKEKILGKMEILKEKVYSRETMQGDMTRLSDYYADFGYANADITPLIKENDQKLTVDVTFDIHKGEKIHFDRIDIAGNIKTRDKVIRRELRISEQDLFSATKIKESIKNLRRLEYFEDVNFSTAPGSSPNRMNLKITVKERPTGTFGVGAGYSTQDRLVGMVEISQNNLFGRGQQLKIQGILGAISHRFRASFTEPYLFDRPLGFGVDVFNWQRSYPEYTRLSRGGDLRLSHPLKWKYTRLFWMYRFENVNLADLSVNASPVLIEASRIHNTSATSLSVRRDSRDSLFMPTKGSDNSISVEMAGIGGDTAYMRYVAESGWYFPLRWGTVGVIHGRVGLLQRLPFGQLPAYEKFYLGGIDTLRGFKYADISPRDPKTGDRIGGDKFIQLNTEYRFPLYKKLGLQGTVFFDAGNVYGTDQVPPTLRTSVGIGVRWFSPMGPLRVEWGYNIRPKEWEKHSVWEFTMGGSF